jgi:hypothetical protein
MTIDILLIIEGEIATTQLIERMLSACKEYGIAYRKKLLSQLKIQDFLKNTIPLFVRCGDPSLKPWIELLTQANRPYIYYIDDNFWQIEGNSSLARYYQHPMVRDSLKSAISNAQSLLTHSLVLASFLGQYNHHVKTLPAFFDFSLIEQVTPETTTEIRIGFAGSTSRVDDLEIVRPLIDPLLLQFPNIVFEFAGILPHGIKPSDRVRFFPAIAEYKQFIKFQAERNWAIGLAPLIDNLANHSKTNNKYREYGACKIAGVYSNITPYAFSVKDQVTGFIVENTTSSWMAAICYLITNSSSRTQIGLNAYSDVRNNYCVNHVANLWAQSIYSVDQPSYSSQSLESVARGIRLRIALATLRFFFMKVIYTYREGGIFLVIRKISRRLFKITD